MQMTPLGMILPGWINSLPTVETEESTGSPQSAAQSSPLCSCVGSSRVTRGLEPGARSTLTSPARSN